MRFGTDGIRGLVNKELDAEKCFLIGRGIAINLLKNGRKNRVLIGRDTRPSGESYAFAVASAIMDYGIDVVYSGVIGTPMVSFAVSKGEYGGGIMITASHNSSKYNGIKVFDDSGEKVSKIEEDYIEKCQYKVGRKSSYKGKLIYDNNIIDAYKKYLLSNFKCDMSGITIVVDCANGSNSFLAPIIYRELGANVIPIACDGDGKNINNNCGSNHIKKLQKEVLCHRANYGIAFDGDGDRLIIVLDDGRVLSGDELLLYFALNLKEKHSLNNLTVVGTIMSSLGLQEELSRNKIRLIRTDVGDKNVIQMLKINSLNLGGESSGHICQFMYNPTCDALLNSLFFLKCIEQNIVSISDVINVSNKYFSVTKNINVDKKIRDGFDKNISLNNLINNLKINYPNANIVVRPSGTEPVIRIFIESKSNIENTKILQKIVNFFEK